MEETVLLIGEQYIRENSVLNNNVDTIEITKSAYYIQDLIIQPILGTTFYREVMLAYSAATAGITPLTEDLDELLMYIKPTLVNHAAAEVTMFLTLNVKAKGVQTQNGDFTNSVGDNTMWTVVKQITKRAEFYEERLRNWLHCNGSKFPTYKSQQNTNTDMVPEIGKSAYNSPIGFYKSRFNNWNRGMTKLY
jgi:hypothetical protein